MKKQEIKRLLIWLVCTVLGFGIRDKISGRIHRIGDECHDGLWVDTGGTVHYFNLQNGDGCSDNSRMDKNAGYEFMPSDFGELVV